MYNTSRVFSSSNKKRSPEMKLSRTTPKTNRSEGQGQARLSGMKQALKNRRRRKTR